MMSISESVKTMGTAALVFLILTAIGWAALLRSIAIWIGKQPVPGRESDRVILQAWSGGFAVLVWILLAGLLLIASSKNVLPSAVGAAAWIVHPLSLVAALAAIAVLYEPQKQWPVLIPAFVPFLIAGYVMYAFFPLAPALSVTKAGIIAGALVVALSLAVVREGIRFRQAHDDGSIDATPGPKLDAWMAKQREKRRADGLEQLSKSDDETKLYEVESLLRGDSPVRKEALDFMRHLPNRQVEATEMLESQSSIVLHFLADIDLQPTPELCKAARGYLREAVRQRRKMFDPKNNSFVGAEFEEGLDAIRWISKNCGCKEELALVEAYAREQNQDAPDVKNFLDALTAIQQEK